MTSQHMTDDHQLLTPDSHLDVYLNGIRQKFDCLNQELDEARNQRDECRRKYTNLAKELQELRRTVVGTGKGSIVCQHCKSCVTTNDNLSPVSSSSEFYSSIDEEAGGNLWENDISNDDKIRKDSTISGNHFLRMQTDVSPVIQRAKHPGSTWKVEFNPDTKIALKLNLVHAMSQRAVKTYAAFSMDGKYLAAVSEIGIIHIYDVKTGKRISVMRDLYKPEKYKAPAYWCLGFSPDSKLLAIGQSDGVVMIWIVSQRRVRNTFKQQGPIRGLDFSPNGQYIAIAYDQTVLIRRLRDGFSRVLKQSDRNFLWSVRFSKDGRYVASGGSPQENRIMILHVRTGKCIAKHGGHDDIVRGLVFTPDGKGLLSASWDNMVIHWDVSWLKSTHGGSSDGRSEIISRQGFTGTLTEISRFGGHKAYASAVSVSPDGNWIATGSWDGTARIWNAHTATLQCILIFHAKVTSVDFSRIGNYLAIADRDGQVKIWYYTDP